MRGLNLELEKAQQDGTEWRFGSSSLPALFVVPLEGRARYLPQGERQNIGEEKNDCATRAPLNALEAQLNYGYEKSLLTRANFEWLEDNGYVVDGRIILSDRFTAIKSGTDPRTGNSLKAPHQSIRTHGVIPKALFPQVPSRDEYYDASKITPAMEALGRAFADRFTINYEQVPTSQLLALLQQETVTVAGYAWPTPIDGVYPRVEFQENHAFLTYDPAILAFDNYLDWNKQNTAQVEDDFIKQLAQDYRFFPYGYRLFISAENENVATRTSLIERILHMMNSLLNLLNGPRNDAPAQPAPEAAPAPKPPSTGQILHDTALSFLGQDASPKDRASDELGCVESVCEVWRAAFGTLLSDTLSTASLYRLFKIDSRFELVPASGPFLPGDFIISPTGLGSNPNVPHGHVGIFGENGTIMSNTSKTGRWERNYTKQSWDERYKHQGGYPVYVFRPIASA